MEAYIYTYKKIHSKLNKKWKIIHMYLHTQSSEHVELQLVHPAPSSASLRFFFTRYISDIN